ncbi:MAG: efflux RND transporter periplasmic adaptor subunit [Flavobacteriales bacterium]|nr:efflux RND transporter periplasmic adaptor subunit [Flavobacteriales bacterium]MBK9286548.1 efflux RND transporter periplasmic adaptor subunit [Flavobacteriales bacterium]MBL0035034.1 efflux RND transporter periplasmic adaptor subunit [Flavobacteriales bacterium]
MLSSYSTAFQRAASTRNATLLYRHVLPLFALGVLLAGCGGHLEEGHEGHEHGRYPATNPLIADTVIQRDYVCQIHSVQHIELRALEKGYLQDVLVDEGQQVKEGQLLFRIRPILYQAEVQRAQAEAEFAEIEFRNTKSLADSNVVSPNELAMAKARYDKAKAELSVAQAHLGFTEITAPFDGIVGRFHVRKGSLLDEGELLTELSDNSSMWVYFNVPEAEYLAYQKSALAGNGTKVKLQMANGEVFDQIGEITAIESDFNNTTGNIAFRATFANPQGLLRHGETGSILMDSRLKDVLLIPQKATFEVLDHRYVYVIDKDNVIHSTRITIGPELQHLFVVNEGLKKDDRILLEGLRKVKDSDSIAFELLPADSVVKHLDLYAE